MKKANREDLPDITPKHIDKSIRNFKSKLCCRVNSVAIVYEKAICIDCFNKVKAKYTGKYWEFRD